MKIAIGADHGGFELKFHLSKQLKRAGHQVTDLGTHLPEPCDYPLIGAAVAKAVSSGRVSRGVLLCKSGGGMGIIANRYPKVRAVVAESIESALHAREHNDCNVLVLGAEYLPLPQAAKILSTWLKTPFAGGRHLRRVRQIAEIEKNLFKKVKR